MKVKQAIRYQMHEVVRPTIIYYIVMAAIFIASLILSRLLTGSFTYGNTSADGTSMIFLFVLGLNMFKNPFKLFIQNGISRRTQLIGMALTALCLALAVALIDSLYPVLFSRLRYMSTFSSFYDPLGASGKISLMGIAWNFAAYYAAITFGYFVTTLYYRMNKPLKVAVSVGVPLLFFIVLPMVEVFVPSFNLASSLLRFIAWALGLDGSSLGYVPGRAVASFSVFSLLMLGLSYLLMRRATLKD